MEKRVSGGHGQATDREESTTQELTRASRRRARPATGDVLVSERSARADVYAISMYPAASTVAVVGRYADAIERVREIARSLGVDGWYTCDHTHYAQVAAHRDAVAAPRADD